MTTYKPFCSREVQKPLSDTRWGLAATAGAGEVIGYKCKEHSDKGKCQKKHKERDEEGGKSSSEGWKAGGRQHQITSRAVVSGTDDDEDDDDGDKD